MISYEIFDGWGVSHSNKPFDFDFGADSDHDPVSGIFLTEFSPVQRSSANS